MSEDHSWSKIADWIMMRRYGIYGLGLLIWVSTYQLFPALPVARSAPFFAGVVLLLAINGYVSWSKRAEDMPPPENRRRYDEENSRITLVQQYGSALLPAIPVVGAAAIPELSNAAVRQLFFPYLVWSLVSCMIIMMPVWVPLKDWRPLSILRHIKTVLMIYSVAWLALSVLALLP